MQDIRTITTRDVKNFGLHLAETKIKGGKLMSMSYREFTIGLLRNIFLDGLRSGDLNRAQVPMFPQFEKKNKPFKFLTIEEQDKVLSKIPKHDRPIFHIILTYGIRPSEVRALKRDAVI
jgi:integrase